MPFSAPCYFDYMLFINIDYFRYFSICADIAFAHDDFALFRRRLFAIFATLPLIDACRLFHAFRLFFFRRHLFHFR